MPGELAKRLIVGPVLAGVALGLIAIDLVTGHHYGILALGAVVAGSAPREYVRLARSLAPGVQTLPIVVASAVLILIVYPGVEAIGLEPGQPYSAIVISLALLWACLRQMAVHALDNFIANVAATLLGVVYLGVALQLLCALAVLHDDEGMRGTKLLVLAIAAAKSGDIFAFFGGRAFGRHKLAPRISPGKTWEGFVASLFGAVGGTYLFDWLLRVVLPADEPLLAASAFAAWWHPLLWGLILGPAGVIGDLIESCLKRGAGVKDSGTGLPGFGGYLDVFDAVLVAAPVACALALVL